MDAPSEIRRRLEDRREAIAGGWYEAISGTCYAAKSAQEVRQDLTELTGKAIDLLAGAPFDASQAEEIGVALARLHYIQAEALGGTLGLLGDQLKDGRPEEGSGEYLSRLVALLGGIATGFFREASRTLLAEQETIRTALVAEIEESGRALLKAQEELEQRVEERTAELERTNQELRVEVAERLRVEGALRESEEKYRRLVEDMNEVIYAIDRKGNLTYISPALETLLGYQPAEVIGHRFAKFVWPENLSRIQEGFQNVLAGRSQANEYRVVTKSGDIRWVLTSSRPIFEGPHLVGVHGLLADITERKLAEEALQASEERWRLLMENAPALVVTVGRDRTIRFINRAREEDGLPAEELLGTDVLGYVAPEYAKASGDALQRVFETGRSDYQEVPVTGRKPSRGRWVRSRTT
jgi:PAS domain S-box-containing protein